MHLGPRVGVGPGPAGQRDVADLLVLCAELDHVPLGHQRERLARREQAVGSEELVVGAGPADLVCAQRRLAVAPARPAVQLTEHQHRRRLSGEDGGNRLPDHGGRRHAARSDRRPEGDVGDAERVGQRAVQHGVALAAHDAVDVLRGEPGVIDGSQCRLGRQGQVAAFGVAGEVGRSDPHDGALVTVREHFGHGHSQAPFAVPAFLS